MQGATRRVDEDSRREMMLISLEERYKDTSTLASAPLIMLAAARNELEAITRLLAYQGEFKRASRFQDILDKVNTEFDKRRG